MLPRLSPRRRFALRAEELESRLTPASYFVSPNGNDNNSGLSADAPWRSFERVRLGPTGFPSKFQPGDSVLFQGGQTFTGELDFGPYNTVTSAGNPVTIGSYGDGKATLRSNAIGSQPSVLTFYDLGGVTVRDLNVYGPGLTVGDFYHGINFIDRTDDLASTSDRYRGVTVDNVDGGFLSGSAVHFFAPRETEGAPNLLGYADIRVTNSTFHDNREAGVALPYRLIPGYYPYQNVYIGNVRSFNNPGSPGQTNGFGLIVAGTDGALVERSVVHDNGTRSGGPDLGGASGIVVIQSTGVTVQYNEVYNQRTNPDDPNATKDGNGIDLDWATRDSVAQFNYVHGNDGGGVTLLGFSPLGVAGPNTNNLVRFNVTENNGRRNAFGEISVFGPVQGADVYGNTAFASPSPTKAATGFLAGNDNVTPAFSNIRVFNNVFVTTGGASVVRASAGANGQLPTLIGNSYFSSGAAFKLEFDEIAYDNLAVFRRLTGQERLQANGTTTDTGYDIDPKLTAPGSGGTVGSPGPFTGLNAYRLAPDSPVRNSGIDLAAAFGINVGTGDFFALPLATTGNKTPNPGADQSPSDVVPPPVTEGRGVPISARPAGVAVGRQAGNGAQLRNGAGAVVSSPGGTDGGTRVASADFNRDGVLDIVVGSGPGVPTLVRVLNGAGGGELFRVNPFEASFTGGVYVAAGDLNGDGVPDLVIAPDQGGGPRIQSYSGAGFGTLLPDFFGIDDPNFRGGARPAIGDVNGDGVGDLLVAAGFGGGPRVTAYDGKRLTAGAGTAATTLYNMFVFEDTLRNGSFIAAGDFNGDGIDDLVAGGGPGGGPRVRILNGADLLASAGRTETTLANFFSGDPNNRGGIRVAVVNLDGDEIADLVTGNGDGSRTRIIGMPGKFLKPNVEPQQAFSEEAFPGDLDGVFVG